MKLARRLACRAALVLGFLPLAPLEVGAQQSGGTLTPDRLTYVINKDVGDTRWTITLNLASLDPPRIVSATGNVFRPGGTPTFVWCQVRDDSTGTLADPASIFRLRCFGMDGCSDTAIGCARSSWQPIADLVELPTDFFLPPGGPGAASAVPVARAAAGPSTVAGTSARGATLTPDAANFLINKDVGLDRWSISLNFVPAQAVDQALGTQGSAGVLERGLLANRPLSVTGNVFPSGGGAPSFVFCQERQDSTGTLADPSSEFRLSCLGSGPCLADAASCARDGWRPIPGADDIRLQASFFLPAGGLPAQPASDPDVVVIGRTSDPPSIGVAATGAQARVAGGGCSGSCTIALGSCASVAGELRATARGCSCVVDDVPTECITCGGGASGSCGGPCSYGAGGRTVRGQCLPVAAGSTECACYAANEDGVPVGQCGGPLGVLCPTGKCCADDLRDGCDPSRGDRNCPGICVRSDGCDPTVETCGICLDQRNATPQTCGTGVVLPGEDCCVTNGTCRDGGSFCFCDAGSVCVTDGARDLCCSATSPKLCPDNGCIPADASCCGELRYCTVGSVCTTDVEKCCPVDKPELCPNGTDCVPTGGDCCGNGRFCAPGTVCTRDPELCCPAEQPQLCPSGTECVPAGAVCCGDGRFCPAGTRCQAVPGGFDCVGGSAGLLESVARSTASAASNTAGHAARPLASGSSE